MTTNFVGNFTDAMKNAVIEKTAKITSKNPEMDHLKAKLEVIRDKDECQLEISLNNEYRVSKSGSDFYKLVTDVVEALDEQVESYKEYRLKKETKAMTDFDGVDFIPVKKKLFFMEPMAVDEAIQKMNALGHTFFVYKDIDLGDDICVIYKRNDGSIGMIQCR